MLYNRREGVYTFITNKYYVVVEAVVLIHSWACCVSHQRTKFTA